jgi:hypothetical protein
VCMTLQLHQDAACPYPGIARVLCAVGGLPTCCAWHILSNQQTHDQIYVGGFSGSCFGSKGD